MASAAAVLCCADEDGPASLQSCTSRGAAICALVKVVLPGCLRSLECIEPGDAAADRLRTAGILVHIITALVPLTGPRVCILPFFSYVHPGTGFPFADTHLFGSIRVSEGRQANHEWSMSGSRHVQ